MSPANVVKAVYGFVLFVLLIVIAHGQSQSGSPRFFVSGRPAVKEAVKAVCGFVLFVLLIVIAHGQSQTASLNNDKHLLSPLASVDVFI